MSTTADYGAVSYAKIKGQRPPQILILVFKLGKSFAVISNQKPFTADAVKSRNNKIIAKLLLAEGKIKRIDGKVT